MADAAAAAAAVSPARASDASSPDAKTPEALPAFSAADDGLQGDAFKPTIEDPIKDLVEFKANMVAKIHTTAQRLRRNGGFLFFSTGAMNKSHAQGKLSSPLAPQESGCLANAILGQNVLGQSSHPSVALAFIVAWSSL